MIEIKPISEPKWKSYIVETTSPIFTPQQCDEIIKAGMSQPRQDGVIGGGSNGEKNLNVRSSFISWIPPKALPPMYHVLETWMHKVNKNHFGFEGMQITEQTQFTTYEPGGFYNWHMDSDFQMSGEPPVRKISMTCLLSDPSEFEGGGLELMEEGRIARPKRGHAIFFASFIRHRVMPVTRGVRKSLVAWFGGTPFK